jgi:hypothetical protein
MLDVPVAGPHIVIEPISDEQEMAIARARFGAAGEKIVDNAWRTPGVRELIATPLYLSALLTSSSSGVLEPAATLNGALTWANQASPFVPELPDVACRLVQQLGQQEFEYATEPGAAMTPREANDYAIAQVDAALVTIPLG